MKLTIYLHDLFYEIGHANVTLNSLNYIQEIHQYDIKFVVFTSQETSNLFLNKPKNVKIHYVPFPKIRPVLFKIIWFHIYTFIYSLFFDKKRIKVSLGIANLNCDISIIHFIHNQWSNEYFKIIKPKGLLNIYKKVHYFYVDLLERYLFKIKKPYLITVSDFMKDYIAEKFNYDEQRITAIKSGFEIDRFSDSTLSLEQILKKLTEEEIDLKEVNFDEPICLFVGAFERKGLEKVLEQWGNRRDAHLIIIGQSEAGNSLENRDYENVTFIKHTKNINLFYEISDYFLFPTIYEPFGMVLIEATIKGLKIISTRKNVGASEVISGLDEIHLFENPSHFKIPEQLVKLTQTNRNRLIEKRKLNLIDFEWKNISKKYHKNFKDLYDENSL